MEKAYLCVKCKLVMFCTQSALGRCSSFLHPCRKPPSSFCFSGSWQSTSCFIVCASCDSSTSMGLESYTVDNTGIELSRNPRSAADLDNIPPLSKLMLVMFSLFVFSSHDEPFGAIRVEQPGSKFPDLVKNEMFGSGTSCELLLRKDDQIGVGTSF